MRQAQYLSVVSRTPIAQSAARNSVNFAGARDLQAEDFPRCEIVGLGTQHCEARGAATVPRIATPGSD